MFAVKGWNVDATSLKAQLTPFNPQSDAAITKSEKRKRKRDAADRVNAPHDKLEPPKTSGPEEDVQGEARSSKKAKHGKKTRESKVDRSNEATAVDGSTSSLKKVKSKQQKTALDKHLPPSSKADEDGSREGHSTKKSAKKAKGDKLSNSLSSDRDASTATAVETTLSRPPQSSAAAKLTPMQAAMRQKLVSARFRHLNETLYTAPSQRAQELFSANPEMFEEYHAGFRQQVAVWPENPVDKMLQNLRERGSIRLQNQKKAFKNKQVPQADSSAPASTISNALPRTQGTCIVADCGCGDARLAQTLKSSNELQKLNLKVLSYDLHSPSPHVIKADIAALPLADGSVDVVIFCLALMGTNWLSFIEEAYRVLHWKGELWIAEIKSRFGRVEKKGRVVEHSVGNRKKQAALAKENVKQQRQKDEAAQEQVLAVEVDGVEAVKSESDVQEFLRALERRGFVLRAGTDSVDLSNKMFVNMELVKAATPTRGKGADVKQNGPHSRKAVPDDKISVEDEGRTLKPCLYKLR